MRQNMVISARLLRAGLFCCALMLGAGCSDSADDSVITRDSDADGVPDYIDVFPNDASETVDADGDGVGDNGDNCPQTGNGSQSDADSDGFGDACDFTILASELSSPRGLSCASTGGIYVALSGAGAGDAPAGPEGLPSASSYLGADGRSYQYGLTGAVMHVAQDGTQTELMSGLPSLAHLANPDPRVWVDAAGPVDVFEQESGELLIAVGLASDSCLTRDGLGEASAALLGTIIDENSNVLFDIAAYECGNNTDQRIGPNGQADYTSNPWRIAHDEASDTMLIVDSGANAVLSIDDFDTGALATYEAGFPDQFQEVPDWGLAAIIGVDQTVIGLPPAGAVIPAQPVPTGMAIHPDSGKVYVAELTGVPIAVGSARVYEIPGSTPAYDGFTALTDIAFTSDGDLVAVEYSADGMLGVLGLSSESGRIVMVSASGDESDFSDRLSLKHPTGVAVCGDTVYVTNEGSVAGAGQVMRASLSALLVN